MKEHKGSACHRNLPSSYDSGAQVRNRGCSLTDRLKLRATRPPAQGRGTKSVPRQGHNTPLPLKRSPPGSFKRLLGGATSRSPSTCSSLNLINGRKDRIQVERLSLPVAQYERHR